MEGIDIDSIVRKAVREYRKEEREQGSRDPSGQYLEDVTLMYREVKGLRHRVEVLEREMTQRYTDLLNRLERHTHGER